jgi:competence protein ComEC
LLLNFAAIPLMTVAQVTGMLAVAVSVLTETGARLVGYVAHLSASGIVESARLMDVLPWLSRRVPAPSVGIVSAYYIGWAVWLSTPRRRGIRIVSGTAVLATGGLILAGPVPAVWPLCPDMSQAMRILFLDVGQADATLVNLPSGHSLLVDAGGTVRGSFDVGGRVVSPVLWNAGVRRLDYLVLTHGDPDHIGGAASVITDLEPREVWAGVPVPASQALRALRTLATEKGAVWRTIRAGDALAWGNVTLRVVHPPPPDWERPEVRNDDSVVLELLYGDVSVVLPGDIGSAVERSLVDSFRPASFRLLKVPHHGSRTSSSEAFVAALRPHVAVVSAGRESPFGHPHPEVIRRYTEAGSAVWQTGEVGAISVCTDGRAVRLETDGRQVDLR